MEAFQIDGVHKYAKNASSDTPFHGKNTTYHYLLTHFF